MRSEIAAGLIVVLLVIFAAGIGIVAGTRARPTPTPRPTVTVIALASATPPDPAEVQRRAFAQPLSSGCATDGAVWLFADGGAAIRFDGRVWTIPDATLRSLSAAACREGMGLAVGGGGSLLTVDEDRRQVRADRSGIEDLHAVALLPDGALAVGSRGTVLRQSALDWTSLDAGASEDLYGVAVTPQRSVARGLAQAWVVGARGASYRLADSRWERISTGTDETLRAVVIQDEAAIAVGDRGTALRFARGAWEPVRADTDADLRAVAVVGARAAWIVGDRGTVIEISGDRMRRVDVGTACTLRGVFAQGAAIWIVGSDGVRGGAWRITPTGTDRWGTC